MLTSKIVKLWIDHSSIFLGIAWDYYPFMVAKNEQQAGGSGIESAAVAAAALNAALKVQPRFGPTCP